MKHRITIISLFLFLSTVTKSQDIDSYKKTTVFFYSADTSGSVVPIGTGFFVTRWCKNSSSLPNFIATAKHVIQDDKGNFKKEVYIRINTSDSNSRLVYARLDTSKVNGNVILNKSKEVDLVLIAFAPTKTDYKTLSVPQSQILNKTDFIASNFKEGDDVFFTGLFSHFTGNSMIYPIFRFGHIALVPKEKIMWVMGLTDLILVEVSSYGGNSGSPVFFKKLGNNGQEFIYLGGVLSGTYRDISEVKVITTKNTPVVPYNNGITGVVPSYFINEMFYYPELISRFGE